MNERSTSFRKQFQKILRGIMSGKKFTFNLFFLTFLFAITACTYGSNNLHYREIKKDQKNYAGSKNYVKKNAVKSDSGKTAGEFYKNIKVLKNIPASRLLPTMHFIEASLGMNCGSCHVRDPQKGWEFDKDKKPEKRKARMMIKMMETINKDSFKGHMEVTCFTCHRGSPDPQKIPAVLTEVSLNERKAKEASDDNIIKVPDRLNTAEQIINKFVSAIGGKDNYGKITSLKYEGTVNNNGRTASVVIYKKAPDLFYYSVKTERGAMTRGYNGKTAWEQAFWGSRELTGDDLEGLKLETDFYTPAEITPDYSGLKFNDVSVINGDTVYVVEGKASQHRNIKLYFNTRTGLLERVILLNRTPLGSIPEETDFMDYRNVNGILIPFEMHRANNEDVEDIKFDKITANTSIDNKLFEMPKK